MRTVHRIALLVSIVLALTVGVWAYFFPGAFYSSFPGLGAHWIDEDGPFNEHLIRDVGGMYLALGAASIVSLVRFSGANALVIGTAWTTFGALHFGYHAAHLGEMAPPDALGNVVTLGLSLLLGIALLIPERSVAIIPSEEVAS